MPNDSSNNSLLQTVTHMIDTIMSEGNGYDTLINLLSLLCIFHVLNRMQPTAAVAPISQTISPSSPANPLQKILGDLTKNVDGSGGGPSPDMLMSLLPLLNNPQVKSKLNPANISSILGLLSNFGGSSNEKSEGNKTDKPEKKESPAAAVTSSLAEKEHPTQVTVTDIDRQDTKDLGNSLNWKTNFQNEKEV